ncbi:hypothetical protein OH492_25480 [Vibrio chagasii]|nr:hypothetical protein [Vibrio chagasii]
MLEAGYGESRSVAVADAPQMEASVCRNVLTPESPYQRIQLRLLRPSLLISSGWKHSLAFKRMLKVACRTIKVWIGNSGTLPTYNAVRGFRREPVRHHNKQFVFCIDFLKI